MSMRAAAMKQILTPSMILNGHGKHINSISYFPDGQRMISGSQDSTARQWDLKAGKEIEEARDIYEEEAVAVAVSRDGGLVVTSGGFWTGLTLRACKVGTGIVKTFKGHSDCVLCIDISMDNTLFASGSNDWTTRMWDLETGKIVAGPFEGDYLVGAVRFSTDSKKLAVKSCLGTCLDIWDVQSQFLDVRLGDEGGEENEEITEAPMFWTNNNKNILAAFSFKGDYARTIYQFDALTLGTVGTPFEGHTRVITGLDLSFDHTLLASAAKDDTIKLWAFQSRQLLASFDIQKPYTLVFSPISYQLTYTTWSNGDTKIYICDTPSDVLAQASTNPCKKFALSYLLAPVSSIATPPPPLQTLSSTVSSLLPNLQSSFLPLPILLQSPQLAMLSLTIFPLKKCSKTFQNISPRMETTLLLVVGLGRSGNAPCT
ncbi:hypothetical protein C8R48DRAFT_65800 [Suillus tomentosus]|nr:hypothetical protein C8R48DRAFT_65800 [Suillus tomentosus]